MSLFDLTGGVAFVTGAGSGIGRRIAVGFAEAGADVGCFDRQADGAKETVAMIEALGRKAVAVSGDVRDEDAINLAVDTTVNTLGPLTVGLNAAGVVRQDKAEEMTLDAWRQVVDINLTGVFLASQAEARHMFANGKGGGSIINIASMSATITNKGQHQAHYNASKAGVMHMSKSMASEWAARNVRVNTISPGYILTPLTESEELGPMHAVWNSATPMARIGRPEELVGPAVFLASKAGSYTTGCDVIVDGGFVLW